MERLSGRAQKTTWLLVAALAVALVAAGSAVWSQNQRSRSQSSHQAQRIDYIKVSELTGSEVLSRGGEEIGDFEDVVFDEQRRRVSYVVVAEGGLIGIGDDLHALPWHMVTPSAAEGEVRLPIEEGVLEDRPGIGDQWPTEGLDAAAAGWTSAEAWRQSPYEGGDDDGVFDWTDDGAVDSDFEMRKATELIGMQVQLSQQGYLEGYYEEDEAEADWDVEDDFDTFDGPYGYYDDEYGFYDYGYDDYGYDEAGGEIDDLLVSSRDGRLDFALIDPDNLAFGELDEDELIAVPWTRIQVLPEQEQALVDLTVSEARQLVISEDDIDRLGDPTFRDRMFSALGADYIVFLDGTNGNQPQSRSGQSRNGDSERMRNGDSERIRNGDSQKSTTGDKNRMKQNGDTQAHKDSRASRNGSRSDMQAMQKWQQFVNQCVGQDQKKAGETISGEVISTGTYRPNPEAMAPNGRSFVVSTDQNDRVRVYVGPRDRVASAVDVSRGDFVTVKGARCEIGNQQVFVATSIEAPNQTFTLTMQGDAPTWQATQGSQSPRQGSQQTAGRRAPQNTMQQWSNFASQCLGGRFNKSDQTVQGQIRNVGTLYTSQDAQAPDGRRYSVSTNNNERVKVYVGPHGQVAGPLDLSRGDQATFRGTRCRIGSEQVFVATMIETDGQTFTLTEKDGVPQWTQANQDNQQKSRRQSGQRR